MSVRWELCARGHLVNALIICRRALGQYARRSSELYIGVTYDPDQRWMAHSSWDWQEMVVLYETTSEKYARAMEQHLIEYAWDRYQISLNRVGGGGGLRHGYGYYYVYVILA